MEPMHKINKVEVRNLQIEDYIQLSQSFKRVYADKDVFWLWQSARDLLLPAWAERLVSYLIYAVITLEYTTTSPKLHKVLGVETPHFD